MIAEKLNYIWFPKTGPSLLNTTCWPVDSLENQTKGVAGDPGVPMTPPPPSF